MEEQEKMTKWLKETLGADRFVHFLKCGDGFKCVDIR